MGTALTDTFTDIVLKKKTGLLSLVLNGKAQHLKIFFSKGDIYRMLFGALRDGDCFLECRNGAITSCFFVDGVTLPVANKISLNVSDIFPRLQGIDRTALTGASESGAATQGATVLDRIRTALIRQAGPVGDLLFSQAADTWSPPGAPTKEDYQTLIGLIQQGLDEEHAKEAFAKEANNVIG